MSVRVEKTGPVTTVILSRPAVRNAVDRPTAAALAAAFGDFDDDAAASVAVLWGEGGTFCAGADLKAVASGDGNQLTADGDGPMGPTRLRLRKPVIAAIAGYAVAGGLELACWCDLRVAEEDAVLGVFCRRFGVPLIDGGTVRLPQLVGLGRALDLILSGRPVTAAEALGMGLVNRVVATGQARPAAEALAAELARLPQTCLRSDRAATLAQMDEPLPAPEALRREFNLGLETIASGETIAGAERFRGGHGRHGK
jgi:enoyl-CoA hydratase